MLVVLLFTVDLYKGNWNASIMSYDSRIIYTSQRFRMFFNPPENYMNYSCIFSYGTFLNSTEMRFFSSNYSFSGIMISPTRLFSLSIPDTYKTSSYDKISFIDKSIKKYRLQKPYQAEILNEAVINSCLQLAKPVECSCFWIDLYNFSNFTGPFSLKRSIEGGLLGKGQFNLSFQAYEFDSGGFVVQGKVLSMIFAFCVILNCYAWYFLLSSLSTINSLIPISFHSISMHISTDFGISLLVLDISMSNPSFFYPFFVIFLVYVASYILIQMRILTLFSRYYVELDNDNANTNDKGNFFSFLIEISVSLSIASLSVSLSMQHPFIFLPYLCSFFLPQIFKSAQNNTKPGSKCFSILISLSRLIPFWYFTFIKENIGEVFSYKVGIVFTIWVLFLLFIILLQSNYGGSFFLPKSFVPNTYSYQHVCEKEVECPICMCTIHESSKCMITPCSHCFHEECLSRWMDEQLICPICRSTLPLK